MYKNVEREVKKILSKFNITMAPVPIEDIVESYGIRVSYAPSEEYSGILIRRTNKEILMGINSNESPTRKRFTMAHELGHYFLDDSTVSIDHRDNFKNEDKPLNEKKVDSFAASLLMPEDILINDFKYYVDKKIFLEEDLENLANKYLVSREAIKWRLVNLGLIEVNS